MSFLYPAIKETRKETIGPWYTRLRQAMFWVGIAACFLFTWAPGAGFLVFVASATIGSVLSSREYYIEACRNIDIKHDLRDKLLDHHENEFVLVQIKQEAIWHGEVPNPAIDEQLAKIAKDKADFAGRVETFLSNVLQGLNNQVPPKDDGKPN